MVNRWISNQGHSLQIISWRPWAFVQWRNRNNPRTGRKVLETLSRSGSIGGEWERRPMIRVNYFSSELSVCEFGCCCREAVPTWEVRWERTMGVPEAPCVVGEERESTSEWDQVPSRTSSGRNHFMEASWNYTAQNSPFIPTRPCWLRWLPGLVPSVCIWPISL